MKKIICGIAAAIIVFVAVIAVVLFNNFSSDIAGDPSGTSFSPKLPEVCFTVMGQRADLLCGYRKQEDSIQAVNTLLPLEKNGEVSINISSEEGLVDSAEVFLYSTDQSRLLENKTLTTSGVGEITASYHMTSLAEEGEDYLLVIRLLLSDGTESFYSVKACIFEDEYFSDKQELLDFTREFSDAACDKNTEFLSEYISYDRDKAGSDLHYVNLYTDTTLVSWGGLNVSKETEYLQIYEWFETQISIGYVYGADISYGNNNSYVKVQENFCVRDRNDKIFLLDYERNTLEHFSGNEESIGSTSILLGIQDPDKLDLLYTDYGLNVYFAVDSGVWYYDYNNNILTEIFSFGEDKTDLRIALEGNAIKLLGINDGNLYFSVKGYMPSGIHEGNVGLALLGYNIASGSCREYFYCDFTGTKGESELCSISDSGLFFVNLGESVYSLDLSGRDILKIYDGIDSDSFVANEEGSLAAWTYKDKPGEIIILDVSNSGTVTISSDREFSVLGFIGQDVVYGRKTKWQMSKEGFERSNFFDQVCIADKDGNEKAVYEKEDILISGAVISETGVCLTRYLKEGETVSPIADDILSMAQEPKPEGYVQIKIATSESKRNYYYINLGRTVAKEAAIIKSSIIQDPAILSLDRVKNDEKKYTAFRYGITSEYETIAEAVDAVFDNFGSVYFGGYLFEEIWNRDSRDLYLTMTLPSMSWTQPGQEEVMASMDSQERGVDIFVYAGVNAGVVDIETAKDKDRETCSNVYEELYLCFGEHLLDLTGCDVAGLLYYVNLRHPVLCLTGDDTSLIITGYTSAELTVYDPATRETKTYEKEAMQEYFDGVGAVFVSFW